jgi:tetratricopeptide (TPR) repeat protein
MSEEHRVSTEKALLLAAESIAERRYADAESIYRQVLSRNPGSIVLHENLIFALCRQKRLDDAIAHYRTISDFKDSIDDAAFEALYLKALVATHACPTPFRRRTRFHRLTVLLGECLNLQGAIAECGCFRGLSSYLLCGTLLAHEPAFTGQNYHIFDSFQGLSMPTLEDEASENDPHAKDLRGMCRPGSFAASLAEVRANLSIFPDITYHPGWIPLSFREAPDVHYRFVHLDVDLYDPTYESLEYFLPRMVKDGLIVSDDYGWPGARSAIGEFCADHALRFEVTPQQQAVIRF